MVVEKKKKRKGEGGRVGKYGWSRMFVVDEVGLFLFRARREMACVVVL